MTALVLTLTFILSIQQQSFGTVYGNRSSPGSMEAVMKINQTFGDNAFYLTYRKEKFLMTKPNKEQNHGIKLMDSDDTVMRETTLKFFKVRNLLMKYNNLNDVVKKSY